MTNTVEMTNTPRVESYMTDIVAQLARDIQEMQRWIIHLEDQFDTDELQHLHRQCFPELPADLDG